MSAIDEIFNEYVNMRHNGLDINQALRVLRATIEALPKSEKGELARYIKVWEKGEPSSQPAATTEEPRQSAVRSIVPENTSATPATPPTPQPDGIKPLKRKPVQSIEVADNARWISCGNCGAKSRTDAVFCYKCGYMLSARGSHDTKQFTDSLSGYDSHYFGAESLLVLTPRDAQVDIELRPQLHEHEVVIGRTTGTDAMRPDVDLSPYHAEDLGVSRLHVAIRHAKQSNMLQIYDLGSANGTFINGQRLHPKEERMLRKGDELRLGHLVLRVTYYHPGDEI